MPAGYDHCHEYAKHNDLLTSTPYSQEGTIP